jgi:hypothetical protein
VQTRRIESNALGDIVAMSSKSTTNTDTAAASPEPEIHTEVATAGWGIYGIQNVPEDASTPKETLVNHSELISNNGTSETITEATHGQHSKQVPTRSHNTTISSVGKSTASESRPKNNDSGASESLLHRLAGPSVGKAGLARDQTEITRVIARVSEGSKYYEVSRHPGNLSIFPILSRSPSKWQYSEGF